MFDHLLMNYKLQVLKDGKKPWYRFRLGAESKHHRNFSLFLDAIQVPFERTNENIFIKTSKTDLNYVLLLYSPNIIVKDKKDYYFTTGDGRRFFVVKDIMLQE